MKAIHADFFRVDEFIQGAEWTLARRPEAGKQIREGSSVWCLPVAQAGDLPPVVLYYTFDDRKVWMLSICSLKEAEVETIEDES